MKKNIYFILMLNLPIALLAMEAPSKRLSPLREVAEQMEEDEEMIILISAEGKEFNIPARAALRSSTIASSLKVQENQNHVRLRYISSQTIAGLIPLLERLDKLLHHNESFDPQHQIYIPRRYQLFINEKLSHSSKNQLTELFQAAEFLDLPFILNAIASIIADKIFPEENQHKLRSLTREQLHNWIRQKTEFWGIFTQQEYIIKHITFRIEGITMEYSIADFIVKSHGEEPLQNHNSLNFSNNKLTSVFGIEMLQNNNHINDLNLENNCLFDFTLDAQLSRAPFASLINLQRLNLSRNILNNLPSHLLERIPNLQTLKLSCNELTNLPELIFDQLPNLLVLDLDGNILNNLYRNLFYYLTNLQEINLAGNKLDNLHEHIFDSLLYLKVLNLNNNHLRNLPPHLFDHLTHLQKLGFYGNQLHNLPEHLFDHVTNLHELELRVNRLTKQDKENIQRALPNTQIKF